MEPMITAALKMTCLMCLAVILWNLIDEMVTLNKRVTALERQKNKEKSQEKE